jgi:hypothetical protein
MRRNYADLTVTILVSTLGFVAVVVGLPTIVTIVFGIGLFAAPGYVFSELLFGTRILGLERATVATGLALAAPVFGGLVFYAVGIPLHRVAWVSLLEGLTIVGTTALVVLRQTTKPALAAREDKGQRLPLRHAFVFGVAIVIALGAVGLAAVGVDKQKNPGFTELWLSPRDHSRLTASLGVSNQQGATRRYRLVLLHRGHVSDSWNVSLANNQTWQRTIKDSASSSLIAELYMLPDLAHPYRTVSNGAGLTR